MGWLAASQPGGASAGHPIEIAGQIYGFIAAPASANIGGDLQAPGMSNQMDWRYGMPGTFTRIL